VARLNIIKEPDPLLRKISKPVTDFSPRFCELLNDMKETMTYLGGVGIAAVQVGVLYRAAILLTEEFGTIAIINPEIIFAAKNKISMEGCLSCPGINGRVRRPQLLTVKFTDLTGTWRELTFKGRDAVIASHEIDHMDGILFVDKIIKN
jgi:peptide deformylase